MKKVLLLVGICLLLFCSMVTIPAAAQPTIRVPEQLVTMRARYALDSYFIMNLSGIPAGYDVTNREYPGWCVEVGTNMTPNVNHRVNVYSSYNYDTDKFPANPNWDKVNYIINNKGSYDRKAIQEVIWYFICNDPLPANNSDAQTLAAEANVSGAGFTPTYGQKIAILAIVTTGTYPVQHSFFELDIRPAVELGDLVWFDKNENGIQEDGEPGIKDVTVRLLNETNGTVATTTTDSQGYYSFSGYPESNYTIEFVRPTQNYRFSPANQGSDDELDSDVIITTGKTPMLLAFTGTNDMSWDAGMYLVEEPGGPSDPGTPTPPPETPNQAPTASGGGPYYVYSGNTFNFNGSGSYDSDGTIVSYLWNFGDGTTSDQIIINHTYIDTGNYTITLTVTDNDDATDTYMTYARNKFLPPNPPTLSGLNKARVGTSFQLRMNASDPDNDNVRFMIDWDDGLQNATFLFPSNQNTQLTHRWTTWGYYTIQVYAEDQFNLTSEISRLVVAVDVQYVGDQGYLIDTDSNEQFDAFYSNSTGLQTAAQRQQTGIYLIDRNGDGDFDYQYDPSTSTYREYPEALSPSYTMLLVGVVVVILVLLLIGVLMRRRTKPKQ